MSSGFILRLSQRTIPKWVIGVAVATPAVAIVQGCLMLDEFRNHHGDAPRPVIPSRGVVVVRSDDGNNSPHLEPLRLLVIGDSLAAGVGVASSGTPVLPETIAKALSRALNGRAVFWTCVGTPGASSSQIVRELHDMEERRNHHDAEGEDSQHDGRNALETKFAEWKNAGREAAEAGVAPEATATDDVAADEVPVVGKIIKKWVTKIQSQVQDFSKTKIDQIAQQITLKRRRTAAEETAIVSQYVSQYDIAIVLTGLNDLKNEYLPFMMKPNEQQLLQEEAEKAREQVKSTSDISDGNSRGEGGGSKDDFSRLLDAVQSKMKPGRPLVVFPAIPTLSSPMFQLAPLNWFLVPLLHKVDKHKKALAEKFPGLVLYVEAPTPGALSEVENQRGPLWSSRQTEMVLLKLTDVGHHVREKVEQLMKQHYQAWTKDAEEEANHDDDDDDGTSLFCNDDVSHVELISSQARGNKSGGSSSNTSNSYKPGSTLIAPDKVHPNDLGYDIWGRHIAAAIVHSWNRNE